MLAVRVGIGFVAVASGALVGFVLVHPAPAPTPVPTPSRISPPPPPSPPPAPQIPALAASHAGACARGVFVNERDVAIQTTSHGWLDAAALTPTKKKPHLHPVDGDVDPSYVALAPTALQLRDRDGQPVATLAIVRPREPALDNLGRVVTTHDLDDADETPCALEPASATVWRTDPMVVEVRFGVAPGCPAVCEVFAAPRPRGLGDL